MIEDPTAGIRVEAGCPVEQSRRQLELLFGEAIDLTPRPFFHVATRRDFAGKWFDSIDDAIGYIDGHRAGTDVYVCGGVTFDPPSNRRGRRSVEYLSGVVGLLADLDVKPGSFESIDAAREFADTVFHGCPPSLLVRSGGGLQAWWLYHEVRTFDGFPEECEVAKREARRFGATIREAARARGVNIDSTHDLARIFRLAGCLNFKYGIPRPVSLERPAPDERIRRYEFSDLESLFIAPEFVKEDLKAAPSVGYLILAPDRSPPSDALRSLLTNHDKARGSWEGERPDLVDQSASALDFSLATIAVGAGWTDQEIADLLVAGRRRRGDNLKAGTGGELRLDYYQRTIARAKAAVAKDRAARECVKREEPASGDSAPPTSEEAREIVRRILGIEIAAVEQLGRGADRALLAIVLADGRRATVGRVSQLLSRNRVRDVCVTDFGVLVPTLNRRTWNEVARALVALIVCRAQGDTDENEAVEWIRVLVGDTKLSLMIPDQDLVSARENASARRDGIDLSTPEGRRRVTDPLFIDIDTGGGWFLDASRRLWVYPQAIRQALVKVCRGLPPALDVIRDRLKALGFEPEQIKSGAGGKTGTRQWWKAPDNFVIFEDDHKREGE